VVSGATCRLVAGFFHCEHVGEHALKRLVQPVQAFRVVAESAARTRLEALELRAAMSLARLWQRQGRGDEARELPAPVYGGFTEGFDTPDLMEARALLEALL
jgi:predicted ATPase